MEAELDAWFDQYHFSFHSTREGRDVILPFRLLVMGDFGVEDTPTRARPGQGDGMAATTMTVRNFDDTMAALKVELCLPLGDQEASAMLGVLGVSAFKVSLNGMQGFHPETLLREEPSLSRVQGLIDRLKRLVKTSPKGTDLVMPPLEDVETRLLTLHSDDTDAFWQGQAMPPAWLEFMITDLEADLNQALNQLLHHPQFQRVEATWRGLHWLVSQSASDPLTQVDLACVSRQRLYQDLVHSPSAEESDVFDLLYTQEYGQYGGRPYAALIGDYQFGHEREDIEVLSALGNICRMAHCPFIGGVSPSFFGVSSYNTLSGLTSLKELLEGRRYLQWRAFQRSETAAYVMLALPHVLLRDLWRYEDGGVREPVAEEVMDAQGKNSLWGNAAFAMGTCLLRSFRRFRVCTHLSGDDGGRVIGLPSLINRETGETLYPLEVLLSENRESDLITLGFSPLNVSKASGHLLFQSANSLRWGYFQRHRDGRREPLGARLGAQLPYLFIILRIAHYLRVIYRENLGSTQSLAELKGQLLSWLKGYVSDVESPAAAVRARRPLRQVALIEADTDASGQWQSLTLVLTPHIRYGGQAYSLEVGMATGETAKRAP